jgi:NAD(P)H dehydrogenase (quinone)
MTEAYDHTIAITGATGQLGGRVARLLSERGVRQRLVVRDAARAPRLTRAEAAVAPGYHDYVGMMLAMRGADTMFMVSGRESPTRVEEHLTAVDAAIEAGVRRIVYTSLVHATPDATFTLARHHHATEEHIRASGLEYTFLRDNMYLDMLPEMAGGGVIRGPGGDGRAGFVARDDVADVAAAVLTGDGHAGETYTVTGAESLSLEECARIMSEAIGQPVRYHDETLGEAYASRAHFGAPAFEVEGWVTSYQAIAAGEFDVVTDVVQRLTGHPAMTLRELLTGAATPR